MLTKIQKQIKEKSTGSGPTFSWIYSSDFHSFIIMFLYYVKDNPNVW